MHPSRTAVFYSFESLIVNTFLPSDRLPFIYSLSSHSIPSGRVLNFAISSPSGSKVRGLSRTVGSNVGHRHESTPAGLCLNFKVHPLRKWSFHLCPPASFAGNITKAGFMSRPWSPRSMGELISKNHSLVRFANRQCQFGCRDPC